MDRASAVSTLIGMLLDATPSLKGQAGQFGGSYEAQRMLLRGLMNMCQVRRRPPEEFFPLQDQLLAAERDDRPTVTFGLLKPSILSPKVRVYRGDILNIKADAIVNAANSSLLGCFIAGHNCIDNCIHSAAGLELRFECAQIMDKAGHPAPVGCAVVTSGWNLKAGDLWSAHLAGPRRSRILLYELPESRARAWLQVHRLPLHLHRRLLLPAHRGRLGRGARSALRSKGAS